MGLCSCDNIIVVDNPKPKCHTKPNCVYAPHFLVKPEDSIIACGENLVIDLSGKMGFDSAQSQSTAIFKVISYTDNLEETPTFVTGSNNNVVELHLTSAYTNGIESGNKFAKITYKLIHGTLVDVGTITIIFKNLCTGATPPPNKVCDPCTGLFIDKVVDISINDVNQPPVTDLQIQ